MATNRLEHQCGAIPKNLQCHPPPHTPANMTDAPLAKAKQPPITPSINPPRRHETSASPIQIAIGTLRNIARNHTDCSGGRNTPQQPDDQSYDAIVASHHRFPANTSSTTSSEHSCRDLVQPTSEPIHQPVNTNTYQWRNNFVARRQSFSTQQSALE